MNNILLAAAAAAAADKAEESLPDFMNKRNSFHFKTLESYAVL